LIVASSEVAEPDLEVGARPSTEAIVERVARVDVGTLRELGGDIRQQFDAPGRRNAGDPLQLSEARGIARRRTGSGPFSQFGLVGHLARELQLPAVSTS
jgi:hypothetical protein